MNGAFVVGVVLVRRPVVPRRRNGNRSDRVAVVRGRDGQYIDPGIHVAGGRVYLRVRPVAVLHSRLGRRLLYAGRDWRGDLGHHWRVDDQCTGIPLLPDDGRRTD